MNDYYKKHIEFTRTIINVSDIPDSELDGHCQDLLRAMPNAGKLYKYRSFKGKSFGFIYDSLKNGYLWIPPANTLNDDFDSILFDDSLAYLKGVVDDLCKDKDRFIFHTIKRNGEAKWRQNENLKVIPFESFLECFDENSGALIHERLIALLSNAFEDNNQQVQHLNLIGDFIKECIVLPEAKSFSTTAYNYNREICSKLHVFSMADSYNLDNMWGCYADSGEGFCIEYDFNKIYNLSNEQKKMLLNTYMVEYVEKLNCLDIEAFVEMNFFNNKDLSIANRLFDSIIKQVTSKNKSWEHENEWRIVLGNIDSRLYADIVSGVIIDRRALNKTNAKKLIRLCQQKGWSIKVRYRSFFDGNHSFIDYDEYINGLKD